MADQNFYRQRSQDEVNDLMDSVFGSSSSARNKVNSKSGRGGQWTTLVMMKFRKRQQGANGANLTSHRESQPRLQEMVLPDNMTEVTALAVEHPTTMVGGSINSQDHDGQDLDDSYYYYYGSRHQQSLSMEKNAFTKRRNFTDPIGAGHHHIESVEDLPPTLRAYDPFSFNCNDKKCLPPLPPDEQDLFFHHDQHKSRRRSLASLLTFSPATRKPAQRKEQTPNTCPKRQMFLSRPRRRPAPPPMHEPDSTILSSRLLEMVKSLPFINDTIFKPIEQVAKLHPTDTVQNVIIIIEFVVALWAVYQLTMLVSAACQIVRSLCMPLVYAGKIMRCFLILF